MAHDIIKLESAVKEQMSTDKSDPNMYSTLKSLTEGILVVKHLAFDSREVDELSHEIASDLYFRLNDSNKQFEIYAPTKYIMKLIRPYLGSYLYYNHNKQEVDASDPVTRYDFIKLMYPKVDNFTENNSLRDTLELIPEVIQETYDKYIRYYKDSKEYRSTLISLYLSIYNNDLIIYDKYTNKSLLLFIYRLIIRNIINYINSNIKDNQSYYDLDSIKIFELSVTGGDYDE